MSARVANHWRVLLAPGYRTLWQVYRQHWGHWEMIGAPWPTQSAAMDEAHRLAKLSHG